MNRGGDFIKLDIEQLIDYDVNKIKSISDKKLGEAWGK